MTRPDTRSNVWRVIADDNFPIIVHADDFAEVMSFIGYNARELLGAPSLGHVSLQIDQLWESEMEAFYDSANRFAAEIGRFGKLLGANGEPFAKELAELEAQDVVDLDAVVVQ